jgi:N-acetylgalactosamine-6-sulfatase
MNNLVARLSAAGAVALSVCIALAAGAAAPRPNIVFILADDWGWGDLSCHGHPTVHTPNLDRLAAEGIDFYQFNVCNPVCSPSRTAAMTGHYPARYGVHEHFADHQLNINRGMPDWLDPRAPTLPRMLQQAGYRTGHFGKWHLTNREILDAPPPADYGFDESAVFNGPAPLTTPERLVDDAVKFIAANHDRPFYVNVWLHETHTPHHPSLESMGAYANLDEQRQAYNAVVADGDRKVGRVLAALRELQLDDNTLVIFSSDNGPEWTGGANARKLRDGLGTYYSVGETGGRRGRKRSLFEGGVHSPLFVSWPGHAPPGAIDKTTVVAATDLLPTLCAAAGVALPADYRPDGENMLPALEGRPMARKKPIFWQWLGNANEPDWWPRLAAREGDWKLVMGPHGDRIELYNLIADPAEQHDVASSEPHRVRRLAEMATAWRESLPKSPPADCISKKFLPPAPR